VTSEILRYEFITKGDRKRSLFILTLLLFVLIDTSVNMFTYNLNSGREVVEMLCLVFIPSISKNILLTYWMKKFGVLANILYLAIQSIISFLVPIIPDFNKYLQAIIAVVYPIIIYFITKRILKDTKNDDVEKNKKVKTISYIFLMIFIAIIVALTSGIFKYYFLTVGSGSMRNELQVGDVIIVKKLNENEFDEIEVGTILVFKIENKVVVHRVIEIEKGNDYISIHTKGDNNKDRDNWVVKKENIIGLTKHKIPLIGLPSVWLYRVVEGRELQ
jgi:signal peptidase